MRHEDGEDYVIIHITRGSNNPSTAGFIELKLQDGEIVITSQKLDFKRI